MPVISERIIPERARWPIL